MTETGPPFELNVYRSPVDGKTVYAHGTYAGMTHGNQVTWPCVIKFGTPVRDAYEKALAFTGQFGVGLVIKDPDGLFNP